MLGEDAMLVPLEEEVGVVEAEEHNAGVKVRVIFF